MFNVNDYTETIERIREEKNTIFKSAVAQFEGECGMHSAYEIEISRPMLSEIFGLNEDLIDIAINSDRDIECFILPDEFELKDNYSLSIDRKIYWALREYKYSLEELGYAVLIYETDDIYGIEHFEYGSEQINWNNKKEVELLRVKYNDPYIGLSMYEACIIDSNNEDVEDTTTGRYCEIDSVLEEIDSSVAEILQNFNEIKV